MKGKSDVEVKRLREANHVLKQWLFEHMDNPYPTVDEKRELMRRTSLSRKRIDAWFKNARHRYMCSASKVVNPNYSRYPSNVTKVLVEWLLTYSNGTYRYPDKEEESKLLRETQLTKVQLRRWFSNARKRGLLQRLRKRRAKKLSKESKHLVQVESRELPEQVALTPHKLVPEMNYSPLKQMSQLNLQPFYPGANLLYTLPQQQYVQPQIQLPIPFHPVFSNVYNTLMSLNLPNNVY